MGLATTIYSQDKDSAGNSLSGYVKNTFNRLRIWDNRSKSKESDSNLRQAFTLRAAKSHLSLPDAVVEETVCSGGRKKAQIEIEKAYGVSNASVRNMTK